MSPTKVIKLKAMQRQILEIPSEVWNGNSRENKKVKKYIYMKLIQVTIWLCQDFSHQDHTSHDSVYSRKQKLKTK